MSMRLRVFRLAAASRQNQERGRELFALPSRTTTGTGSDSGRAVRGAGR
jgi:hypothetical protein